LASIRAWIGDGVMAIRDIVQAAAGVGGGGEYVEDVFSTYLYKGNGATQTIENGIALGDSNYGPSVEFDGTSDYLSRSSDMTGNVDSKTFTLSCWFYSASTQNATAGLVWNTSGRFGIGLSSTGKGLAIRALTSANGWLLDAGANSVFALETWSHLLISIDLNNSANRYVYLNDTDITSSISWATYNVGDISFTEANWFVASSNAGATQRNEGRQANTFLDYTYRDLSVTNNRRLFITADGQPATGLASLSPILYMPLDGSTASVGTNSGTGGDFTVNGSPTVLTQGGPYIESGYGQGGLVWIKSRSSTTSNENFHFLSDSARGKSDEYGPDIFKPLYSNETSSQDYLSGSYRGGVGSFNSNGFTLSSGLIASYSNNSSETYVSWTFRKAPKFFDVVTWTGNGVAGREIPHSLGSVPGCVIIKCTSTITSWQVYHIGAPTGSLVLQSTAALDTVSAKYYFGDDTSIIAPTSTNFTVGGSYASSQVNGSGATYVAYVFAHDAGGFGDDGEQNVISCGSFTTDGSGNATVNLGYEPQFILDKITTVGDWRMFDSMRGIPTGGGDARLLANDAQVENSANDVVNLTATGFTSRLSAANTPYIYIAIRRPMKTPEAGTEVFMPLLRTGTDATAQVTGVGFAPDLVNVLKRQGTTRLFSDRLRGRSKSLLSTSTNAETTSVNAGNDIVSYNMDGITLGPNWNIDVNSASEPYVNYFFKRAPGFMDVVAFTQVGTSGTQTINHNLTIAPQLVFVKSRAAGDAWKVGSSLVSGNANLNQSYAFSGTSPVNTLTTTTFGFNIGSHGYSNGMTFVSYLFSTLAGVSKVGSYTGTGADLNVDCGFSAGARFILIKRTDEDAGGSSGDWYVWDSVRGIAAGNDPYLLLNSTAAEVTSTDYIDPLSSGFTVTSSAPAALNASGGSYIFLAIA
jgi:hypothetical protein